LPHLRQGVAQEFSPLALRVEEITEAVNKGWDISREIYSDYRRILKELQANRVRAKIIEKVDFGICQPLDGAINGEFPRSDESLQNFRKTLEDKRHDRSAEGLAKQQLDQLIERLSQVLAAMGEIRGLNELIKQLVRLEGEERAAAGRFDKQKQELQDDILRRALEGGEDKKP
jgi:hypothetical protein